MYKILAVYFAVFAASFVGVSLFRRWSLRREMLDMPNERSSHSVPTPRGGGLIICAVSILTFLAYTSYEGEGFLYYWSYFAGALIVAVVSLIDDVRTLSPFVRIFCHCLAAGFLVWSIGGFGWLLIPFYGIVETGFGGDVLAFLWIVWLINAYNFMDGIDGIAGTQTITAGVGWILAGIFLGFADVSFYAGVLAFSAFGFLILNWQPAKIFMGDVGSAFLGYSFAFLPLLAIKRAQNPSVESILPWIGVFLVWFFVFDSVFTFLKRLLRGAKVWQPHREHIYQKMVIAGLSHSSVTIIYGLASAVLVSVVAGALKYSWNFEKTLFATVFLETILLVVFWQKTVRGGNIRNFS